MSKKSQKRQKQQVHASRRQVLGMIGGTLFAPMAATPLRVALASMVDGIIMRAQAQAATNAVEPRNYVVINLPGGPPRWNFDMPLTPYKVESLVQNNHVMTRFTSSTGGSYVSTPVTKGGVTLNMPHLWTCQIPTSGGGSVPMSNLIDNMLMIRGVNLGSDGHSNNAAKQTRPTTAAPSLDGSVADRSTKPIPAVGLDRGFIESYKSAKGVGLTLGNGSGALGQILSPFNKSADNVNGTFAANKQTMDAAIDSALTTLGAYSKSRAPGSESLFEVRNSAESLIRKGIGDVNAAYSTLYSKYRNLVTQVASTPIPGITDQALSIGSLGGGVIRQTRTNGMNGFLGPNADLRNVIHSQSYVGSLAENFAVAEFLLVNGYSSSINMGTNAIFNLGFQDFYELNGTNVGPAKGNVNGEWAMDEHEGGSFLSLICNAFLFRSLSACLYELITVLKSRNLFDETVIQISSEFSRTPRGDQSGSDHGWPANNTSVLSGVIKQPIVVGNCSLNGSQHVDRNRYPGSWGAAATTAAEGFDQELTIGHSAATVASLLRVKSPSPNNKSLVNEVNGAVTAAVELAKNK